MCASYCLQSISIYSILIRLSILYRVLCLFAVYSTYLVNPIYFVSRIPISLPYESLQKEIISFTSKIVLQDPCSPNFSRKLPLIYLIKYPLPSHPPTPRDLDPVVVRLGLLVDIFFTKFPPTLLPQNAN